MKGRCEWPSRKLNLDPRNYAIISKGFRLIRNMFLNLFLFSNEDNIKIDLQKVGWRNGLYCCSSG
jgi:hypothetical protein